MKKIFVVCAYSRSVRGVSIFEMKKMIGEKGVERRKEKKKRKMKKERKEERKKKKL